MNKINKETKFSKYILPNIKTKKWKKIRLIDTTNKKIKWSFTGGPFGSNLQSSDYTNDGIRVIQLQNIGDGVFNNDYKIYTSEKKANELLSCNIYPNEILISKMGDPVGRACIVPEQEKRYVMCSDGIRIVVDEDKYSKDYIYYAINSEAFRLKIFKNSTGSTRRRIGLDILKNLEMLILKEKEEQEKIAECLKSIDDLILQEEDKLEKLKSHKKGLLQKLFPKDNKSMPELRFPQYKEQWLLEKLIKKVIYKNGKAHEDSIVINGRYIVVNSKFISTNGLIKKYSNSPNLLAKKGDILVVLSDVPNGKALGKCFMVDKDETYTVNQRVCCLTPVNIDKKYLFFILNRNNYFLSFDDGIGQTNLKKEDVLAFSFYAPQNSKEQQKIANCISSIDDLISAQTRKIELLKQHKKGLLQSLFPSIEEVENE